MKHAMSKEIIKVMPLHHARGNPGSRAVQPDPVRIQGGNWIMQGLRRSGHVYDEDESQMSIAEFMGAPERFKDTE